MKSIPLILAILGVSNISSDKWPADGRDYLFSHRIIYTLQLIGTRKFNRYLSLQVVPTYIHRNLVKPPLIRTMFKQLVQVEGIMLLIVLNEHLNISIHYKEQQPHNLRIH